MTDSAETMREALQYITECFDAAYVEGLADRLAEASDRDDAGSLADLVERRMLFANQRAIETLAALSASGTKSDGDGE